MNAEQKQRAADLLSAWRATAYALHGDRMAALLQELVDAPEPEPFGYFKSEPFGWTDCAETDDGAIALYTAPPAPSVPDGWRIVIKKEFPLYDEDEIDEDKHCCEWVMLQERKRLHKILAAPTPAEAPADVARDSVASEPVGYLYTNMQSGEYHVSDADDDYRGPERVLWCIEPVYRRAKGQS